ncbi:helix-turn-helix transcriptional regulator [Trinickia terrae]|uniref:Helix-turn-helix transcriptional regulator n=1 Tax=Trinickia terrae TaxID=2571161 RepID=A0A4V5PJF8_9BURK|nr:helix-turn-helix transcriptional regulator [Trinickia terrae]TKC91220.1 helix-turn-helix transcriptional regulator [Trinickia terrae]
MDYPLKTVSQLRPILQGFRKSAGLTQAALASQLGITQQSYAQLEANPAAASLERLFKVMRMLDVEIRLAHVPPGSRKEAPARSKPARPAAAQSPRPATAGVTKTSRKSGTAATKKREDW